MTETQKKRYRRYESGGDEKVIQWSKADDVFDLVEAGYPKWWRIRSRFASSFSFLWSRSAAANFEAVVLGFFIGLQRLNRPATVQHNR
jgi:hypothetical protein